MSHLPRPFGLLETSAIREIANIGLGHATTALAEVSGKSFHMDIPEVATASLEDLPRLIGGDPEELTVGIRMPIEGDVTGETAFLFPWESARALWTMLLGTAPQSVEAIDELAASAMLEVGNILSSSFLSAISDLSGLRLQATPPQVSVDLLHSIVGSVVIEAEMSHAVALAIQTRLFSGADESTTGTFLYVPALDGLQRLFAALGIPEAA